MLFELTEARQIHSSSAWKLWQMNRHAGTSPPLLKTARQTKWRLDCVCVFVRFLLHRKEMKVVITVFLVNWTFILCWLPHMVGIFCLALTQGACPWPSRYFAITTNLAMLNSACNPLIYSLTNKSYRRAFKKLFRCRVTRVAHGVDPQCSENWVEGRLDGWELCGGSWVFCTCSSCWPNYLFCLPTIRGFAIYQKDLQSRVWWRKKGEKALKKGSVSLKVYTLLVLIFAGT